MNWWMYGGMLVVVCAVIGIILLKEWMNKRFNEIEKHPKMEKFFFEGYANVFPEGFEPRARVYSSEKEADRGMLFHKRVARVRTKIFFQEKKR